MAKMPPIVIKLTKPVSLMKHLAIPLGCQRTTTKWLVIIPIFPRCTRKGYAVVVRD